MELWSYQKQAVKWILDHPSCGLFLEMGLGKTVTTLTAVKELLDDFAITRCLVIAPLRVAATVWQEEAAKWEHLAGLHVVKVLGSREEREAALREDADVYVINRENTAWLVDYWAKRKRWPYDMLVIDELSSFKSAKSQRFRALRRVRPHVDRVVGLTGTPAPNGLIDLWSQVYLLDRGERLGLTLGSYRARYFDPGRRNAQIVFEWVPKPGADAAISRLIGDICMSMKAEDYIELPDRIDIMAPVVLPDEARRAYDTLAKEFVLPYIGQPVTAQNAAVLTGKLLQLANGAVYKDDGNYMLVHNAKLDALEDLIEQANGQPVLVYYAYQHDAQRIMQRIPQARRLATAQDVNDWNAGRIPVLLAHPDSAGHGLNLQRGGHIIIWFGLTWSLEKYQQANARLHRQGQDRPVTVYHVIAAGTMDEKVLQALAAKDLRQEALIDAVKGLFLEYSRDGAVSQAAGGQDRAPARES